MAFGDRLWTPSKEWIEKSNLTQYTSWLKENRNLEFQDYAELHQWSIQHMETFWETMLEYFHVVHQGSYDRVMSSHKMPGVRWFEGLELNYVENLFAQKNTEFPAIISWGEKRPLESISWDMLEAKVASYQALFKENGITKGDCIAAFLPNCVEASIAFMACCSLGAIWSSCSPDFGISSVLDRFEQIEPKIFIACDGYMYNGKPYYKIQESQEILDALSTVELAIMVPFVGDADIPDPFVNSDTIPESSSKLSFERVGFNDPIWVLYSSGTTGRPKAITHSHGGVLLEHLKYIHLHNDVKPGEKFFWYSTTGWMMWNFLHASMLGGATIVIYDGSPAYPNMGMLWERAAEIKLEHFGTSAPYLVACMKRELKVSEQYDLSNLRSIGSTGAPLPPEGFEYVMRDIKSDLWLCSMAGGTDICTAWVGSVPWLPVNAGEIQCRTLGTDMEAWDESGKSVVGELGEMVVKQAMPCMPIYFWKDPNNERYQKSYFDDYPGIWRHGDWIRISEEGSVVIFGRSDATLNRQGVRIGTAEIYRNLNDIVDIQDSLIVNLELENGDHYMPLFVQLKEGLSLTDEIVREIKYQLKTKCTPRHVPDEIFQVPDIPMTISGKIMEAPVKKILMGLSNRDGFNRDAMKNPEAMDWFFDFKSKRTK